MYKIKKDGEFLKFRGTKEEVEDVAVYLMKQGYLVFYEPYDDKLYSLAAKKI